MGPHYATCQFDPVSTSGGSRKHLNFIIHDHALENDRTYGRTRATEDASPSASEPSSQGGKVTWDAAATGQQEGHEYAIKVSHRRTPSGQFFQTINPTLYQKESPRSTYNNDGSLTQKAFDIVHGTSHLSQGGGGGGGEGPSGSNGASPQPNGSVGGGGGASFGTMGSGVGQSTGQFSGTGGVPGGVKPWTMPWQTGDRVVGGKMARAIHKGRTPTGAFANLDLAKANK